MICKYIYVYEPKTDETPFHWSSWLLVAKQPKLSADRKKVTVRNAKVPSEVDAYSNSMRLEDTRITLYSYAHSQNPGYSEFYTGLSSVGAIRAVLAIASTVFTAQSILQPNLPHHSNGRSVR